MQIDRFTHNFNPKLPLWERVVFVDWHGVLSLDVFWSSILANPRHPFHSKVKNAVDRLFRASDIVEAWMRGQLSYRSVIASMDIQLDKRCKEDYLIRRLIEDCSRMRGQEQLLNALRGASTYSHVVIATDNMDCFVEQAAKLRNLRGVVDAIICSSDVGVLKSEDPVSFFGPWLQAHNLGFSDALLIDDSYDNCRAFTMCGGQTLQFNKAEETIQALNSWLMTSILQEVAIENKEGSFRMAAADTTSFHGGRRGQPTDTCRKIDFCRGQR